MHDAGAGAIGDYDRAMFQTSGTGSFRPLDGATPAIGRVGDVERVAETRLEMVAAPGVREPVRAAMLAAHPYEEVAYSVTASVPRPAGRGSGRIGQLPAADEPRRLRRPRHRPTPRPRQRHPGLRRHRP